MNYSSFFVLEVLSGFGEVECSARESIDDGYKLMRGEVDVPDILTFDVIRGKKQPDFITTDWLIILFSDRIIDLFNRYNITGWDSFDAPIYNSNQLMTHYNGLVITGKCGAIDRSLSEKFYFPPPVPEGIGHDGLKGMLFPFNTWDGSDIFCPDGTILVIVTQRVKKILEKFDDTGCQFIPITDIENFQEE